MPIWFMLLILGWVAVMALMLVSWATNKTRQDDLRQSVTGEVIDFRHEETTLTTGMLHTYIVVVRTDDDRRVELVDPPYRTVALGDRIVQGKLVRPPNQDGRSAGSGDAR